MKKRVWLWVLFLDLYLALYIYIVAVKIPEFQEWIIGFGAGPDQAAGPGALEDLRGMFTGVYVVLAIPIVVALVVIVWKLVRKPAKEEAPPPSDEA
jgi:hypothetical protein